MKPRHRPNLISRRILLTGLLASVSTVALARAPTSSIRPRPRGGVPSKPVIAQSGLVDILAAAGLSGSKSVVLMDAVTGEVLESSGAKTSLPPASVTKAMTALYVFSVLGNRWKFSTRVIAMGPVVNGVVQGDLALVGGGDPALDTDALGQLAERMKLAGITGIKGRFLVYSEAIPFQRVIDKEQPDHVGYNPAISGLNLNFNRIYFEWKRGGSGYSTSMQARAKRFSPAVRSVEIATVKREAPVFTYKSSKGLDRWSVATSALGKAGSRWLPVRTPDIYAGEVFRILARQYDVQLPQMTQVSAISKGTEIARWDGASMQGLIKAMMKYSTNLTAEATGMTATLTRGVDVKTLEASARSMTEWLRQAYGIRRAQFVDHSGLGSASRVSAGEVAQILQRAGWTGRLRGVMKDIPLKNEQGKKAPVPGVSVVAKTGTLNFASALAGYISCPNGRKLVFAIFTADMKKRNLISKAQRERPKGSKAWSRRSKKMQQKLLRRWVNVYGQN